MSEVLSPSSGRFVEMTNDEQLAHCGGFVITTAMVVAGAVSLFTAGFAGGIAVGLNRVNR